MSFYEEARPFAPSRGSSGLRRASLSMSSTYVKEPSTASELLGYWVSAVLAEPDLKAGTFRFWMALLGAVVHVAAWGVIVGYDTYLWKEDFNKNSFATLWMLQSAAYVTLWIAAGIVIVLSVLKFLFGIIYIGGCKPCGVPLKFPWGQEELLPPFISAAIIANIRASLEFSKVLLFFSLFEPVLGVQGADQVGMDTKQKLILIICLKYYGISMTRAQHSAKVFDELS